MKNFATAIGLWVFSAALFAQGTEPASAEGWNALRARAAELHEQSRQMRAEAERKHAETAKACLDKLLTASCLTDADDAQKKIGREAKRIEHEARDIERKLKTHDRDVKQAQKLEDAPRHEAEAARRAEKNRREQEEARRRVEKKQAEAALRGNK